MAKFHINPKGEAGECKAKSGSCPFGGEEKHHSSPEAAREAFEKDMKKEYTLASYIYRKVTDKTVEDLSSPVKERLLRDVESGDNKIHESQIGKILSQDKDVKIRVKVAQTVKSQKVLTNLGNDQSKLVRQAVAAVTHNRVLLKKMLTDEDPEVRKIAAANSYAPRRIAKDGSMKLAEKAMKSAKEARIREALAVLNESGK